jgi:hypothetical protein
LVHNSGEIYISIWYWVHPELHSVNRCDPCPEDDEFFDRPDAAAMEEAISLFMDGMEAQERGGFNDLHGLVGRLPVPTVKAGQAMAHKDVLGGGFIQSMT